MSRLKAVVTAPYRLLYWLNFISARRYLASTTASEEIDGTELPAETSSQRLRSAVEQTEAGHRLEGGRGPGWGGPGDGFMGGGTWGSGGSGS